MMTFEERWTDIFTRLKNNERVPQDTTEPTPAEIAGCRSKPFMQTPYHTYNEPFHRNARRRRGPRRTRH